MAKKKKTVKAAKSKPLTKPVKVKATKPKKKAIPAKKVAAPKKAAAVKKAAAPAKAKKVSAKKAAPPVAKPVKVLAGKKAAPTTQKPVKVVGESVAKETKKSKAKASEVEEAESSAVMERPAERDVFLTDAEGRRLCKVKDCDQLSVVEFYCRYHYLLFWKKIQNRKKILSEGKLEQYIEELTSRYPIKFLELIRKDLHTEADFLSAIQELDIDESSNLDEFEEDENFIDEVRGISADAVDRTDEEF